MGMLARVESPPSPVVVYTTRFCGFCHAAKRLLNAEGVAFDEVPCDGRADLRAWIRDASGQHTVPQVFIHGRSIGGYRELSALVQAGELEDALDAGADPDTPPLPW